MTEELISRLEKYISETEEKVSGISEEEMSRKPAPGKWSKKEIIGHLIDSAVNNQARFVRAQFEPQPFVVQKYAQNEWVEAQKYNEMKPAAILNLWSAYNRHIIWVIKNIPVEKLAVPVDIGAFKTFTLGWLIEDYVDHMEHHLKSL